MNDDGYPPVKIPIHQLNTYNIETKRPSEIPATEKLSMLNSEKTKTYYNRAIKKYDKFFNSTIPSFHVYKYLT